jgi:DNA-binding ferritin-like protein
MTQSTPAEGRALFHAGLNQALAEANNPESEDLMIQRITTHEKALWMLRSFLKS